MDSFTGPIKPLITAHQRATPSLASLVRLIAVFMASLLITACGGGGDGGSDEASGPVVGTTHQVDLFESPIGAGTSTGEGQFAEGEKVRVSTTPAVGYAFVNWTDSDGNVASDKTEFEITVDQAYILRANYRLIPTITQVSMPENGIVTGFEATNAAQDVLFAITQEATIGDGFAGLWRSDDDGANWNQAISGGVRFVSIASGNSDLVMAGVGNAYYLSTDGGVNWSSNVINEPIFGNPMSFNDASARTAADGIYLATSDVMGAGLYKSVDLGSTWSHVLSEVSAGSTGGAQLNHVMVSPTNPDVVYASTTFGENLWKSVDGGSSFFSIRAGLSTANFLFSSGLALDPQAPDRLFVRDNLTVNGGSNWSQVADLSPDNTFWLDGDLVRFSDENFDGYIEISKDSGSTWNTVMPLVQEDESSFYFVDDVYPTTDAVYVEQATGGSVSNRIFKVDLATLKDRINRL